MARKVCPVVIRKGSNPPQILAFRHPSAGKQLVKGTIEAGENAADAALRELAEESGLSGAYALFDLGEALIEGTSWHFFVLYVDDLPATWDHQTTDDHGHVFSFFWHPLGDPLDDDWHSQFHEALRTIEQRLSP